MTENHPSEEAQTGAGATESSHPAAESTPADRPDRREALSRVAMLAGLVGGYGTFAALAARSLFPTGPTPRVRLFVGRVIDFEPGQSLPYTAPDGQTVTIMRTGQGETEADFIALSDVCPHLGCRVHWEPGNERFFCPCHNGAFDPQGRPIAGPPKDANQPLTRFKLVVEDRLLFVELPLSQLA